MKLSEMKEHLGSVTAVNFRLPQGIYVPAHFHVTEVGLNIKHFIDCGGTVRNKRTAIFQLWCADDTAHRLMPEKLLKIIGLSERVLDNENLEVEVEYQADTIGLYGLDFNGEDFVLTAKQTACLAQDSCGIPQEKQKITLSQLNSGADCTPGSGCC